MVETANPRHTGNGRESLEKADSAQYWAEFDRARRSCKLTLKR